MTKLTPEQIKEVLEMSQRMLRARRLNPKIYAALQQLAGEVEGLRKSVRHYEDRIEEECYNACEWAATANIIEEDNKKCVKALEILSIDTNDIMSKKRWSEKPIPVSLHIFAKQTLDSLSQKYEDT